MHIVTLPSPQVRKTLQALKRILTSEAAALRELRQIATQQFAHADDDEQIRFAVDRATADFQQAMLLMRMQSRAEAKAQAGDELEAYVEVSSMTEEDRTRSHVLSHSLASAMGMAALILLGQGKHKPGAMAVVLEDYRIRRIAATEIPNAYSRAHYEINPPDGWARRWDATLDKKVCATCRSMHGETVQIGESFSDGLVPGDVHPNCRCVPTFIPLALLKAA